MNRFLMAGCAAVALTMGCGAANAQAKFDVKVGGDAYFEAGFVSQDRDANLRSVDFRNRFRLNVTPTAKLDNGLEYGARVRIRANADAGGLDNDRAYIFVQGSFGQVRLGMTNSIDDDLTIERPIDYLPLSIYDGGMGWFNGTSASTNTAGAQVRTAGAVAGGDIAAGNAQGISAHTLTANGNSTKLWYVTPRFAGFQAGLSYTPKSRAGNDNGNTDVNRFKNTNTGVWSREYADIVELNLNHKNNIGPVTLNASLGFMTGSATKNAAAVANSYKDLNTLAFGAQVGYQGFMVGGGVVYYGKSGQTKAPFITGATATSEAAAAPSSVAGTATQSEEAYTWNVGAQYATGPVSAAGTTVLGVGYYNGRDPGMLTIAGRRNLQVVSVGASYNVAPGLTGQLEYNHFDAASDIPNSGGVSYDDKGSVVMVRSIVAF
jgi:hypothetical protein